MTMGRDELPPIAGGDAVEGADRAFFGRRKGKRLRAVQEQRLEELLPSLRVVLPAQGERLDPIGLFPVPVDEVWLEIGFGGGEHLAA